MSHPAPLRGHRNAQDENGTAMTALQATDRAVAELALRSPDLRALGRRLAVPAVLAAAVVFVLVAGGHAHALIDDIERDLGVTPAWAALGVLFECLSLAGYVALLAFVAGRATHRIGGRESAQITFAGTAATRLLPTAGAGGLGLTVWALRRAGLSTLAATRTLLTFLVVLYAAFLAALAVAGGTLALGLVRSHGPEQLSAVPAGTALGAIALCLALALRHKSGRPTDASTPAGAVSRTREHCWARRCTRRAGWCALATCGWRARPRTGHSTRPSSGRCCTRSDGRRRCPSSCSHTSSASSPTRFPSPAQSAAGWQAC